MKLEGNAFLISGGSSGLGAACVRLFAAAGARVVIADVKVAEGENLAKELGSGVRFVHTEVRDEASVQAAVTTTVDSFGSLRGAISCAGIGPGIRLLGRSGPHPLPDFRQVIEVNLIGTFNVLRLAAAAISQVEPDAGGERGVIINTASVAAFEGQIGQVAYAASKGGIAAMALPAARELARLGIRVMTIAPGIFDTPLLAGLPAEVRTSLGKQPPFPNRLGRPLEFAALARHIVENEMLNAELIRLDGGLRLPVR